MSWISVPANNRKVLRVKEKQQKVHWSGSQSRRETGAASPREGQEPRQRFQSHFLLEPALLTFCTKFFIFGELFSSL